MAHYANIEQGSTWDVNPEFLAYTEKECGKVPENQNFYSYYYSQYNNYKNGRTQWEAVFYYNEEVFDPENYNDKSIKR